MVMQSIPAWKSNDLGRVPWKPHLRKGSEGMGSLEGVLGGGERSRKEEGKALSKAVVWSWV